jgi:hypothetical protein
MEIHKLRYLKIIYTNMEHLKRYKIFENNTEIDEICRRYNIENYTINSDNSIDVDGDVDLWNKVLTSIPLNFNIVNGYFDCSDNHLTSLRGCPVRVGGWFSCSYNILTSLQYSPQYVENGNFYCSYNKIESLQYCTELIRGGFYCTINKLTSLQYHPTVYGEFYCYNNEINTFENFYYFKEDIDFWCNPIYGIYLLFNDMKLIELANYYGFEYEGEIDLYKLDIFLKETKHEYKGDLRKYFEGKKYKWKLID